MKQQLSLSVALILGALALQGCSENHPSSPPPLANSSAPETGSLASPEARTAAAPVLAAPTPAAPAQQAPPSQQVAARLSGNPISMDRLNKALLEGYGLNMLVILVQLDYTKQEAARSNIIVTTEDIAREREINFASHFPDIDKSEYALAFESLLKNTHTSRVEWDILFETNAYIRKLIEPQAKAQLPDSALELAYRQMYGETVQIRHIEVGNLAKVVEVKRRLAANEPFEKVATELSENAHTAPLGGELRPFSRADNYDQVFKDAAFALKEGEVSDAIQLAGVYQIIKLERRIPPKVVKFEDVKESIREDLTARIVQAMMEKRRGELRDEALRALVIDNPVLKGQYDDQIRKRDQQITNRNEMLERWQRERDKILQAASQPSTQPAPSNILDTPAPKAPEVARPPASPSGAQ